MKEINGNIWDHHLPNTWVCITTNGTIKKNGEAVMGRGVAREAARRYPAIPYALGRLLEERGNIVHTFPQYHLLTIPVKHQWFEQADPKLIARSIDDLVFNVDEMDLAEVYLVRPGCGNGELKWVDIKPIISPKLDDRFTVVELYG